jgi:(3S)-malyl-CoA thioesterase
MITNGSAPRSLLYVPGSNARALEKARNLAADLIIIDLEDAVPMDRKAEAREAMRAAVSAGYAGKQIAVRVNSTGHAAQAEDIAALAGLKLDAVVLPKVECAADLSPLIDLGLPILAMIETPVGVFAAQSIAAHPAVAGLIAGLNDLAYELKLPNAMDRSSMALSIQMIVLAARAGGKFAFDGVYNAIDDADGFAAEVAEGHALGFDGKTLIHPSQVAPCNRAFFPSERAIAEAEALVAAATGGAQRHNGQMIEDMHVAMARSLLARVAEARASTAE